MSDERMVRHGMIAKLRVRYELCSDEAQVEKEIVWVPESLAAKQGKILGAFERFQEELSVYRARSNTELDK